MVSKIDEALVKVQCRAASALANAGVTPVKANKSKVAIRVMSIMTICASLAFAFACNMFAAGTLESKIGKGLGDTYKLLISISIPIAIIAAVACGLLILFGGQKGIENAKKFGLGILVALAIVLLAPVVITTVSKWFAGNENTTGAFDGALPTG